MKGCDLIRFFSDSNSSLQKREAAILKERGSQEQDGNQKTSSVRG